MPIVALLAAAAGLVWGAIYARRGSLILGCAALVIVGYALGHTFWHAKIGPLTVTLDRVLLVGVFAAFVVQWRTGRLEKKPLCGCDWLLFALLGVLTASALTSGTPDVVAPDGGTPLWRLTMSFLVPAGLYWIARQVAASATRVEGLARRHVAARRLSRRHGLCRNHAPMVAGLPALHFRSDARHSLRPRPRARSELGKLGHLSDGLPVVGVDLAAVRAADTSIGADGGDAIDGVGNFLHLHALDLDRFDRERSGRRSAAGAAPLRLPAFTMAALIGGVVVAATWSNVVDLEREGTGEESHHSIDQRKSFAYVSWKMFNDNPIFGVGFGRFYDRKLPYLSDRSQDFELESLRPLHHHNTLLSLLTETGMVGLAAFMSLLVAWARMAWSLAKDQQVPSWARAQGVLMLAVMATYLSSAVFHDLTLLPQQQWLLFMLAGLTLNLRLGSQIAPRPSAEKATVEYLAPSLLSSPAVAPSSRSNHD